MIFSKICDDELKFTGTVSSGIGEGAFYVKIPEYLSQFTEILGGQPYFGTLNIYIDDENNQREKYYEILNQIKGKRVKGFTTNERTYGSVECFDAIIYPQNKTYLRENALILNIHRTSHKYGTLELLSQKCLRDVFGLKDDSKVIIELLNK
jgi:riboflavin kinase